MRRWSFGLCLFAVVGGVRADLKSFIAEKDSSFRWEKRLAVEVAGMSCLELGITSQTWKNTTWKHLMTLVKPAGVAATTPAIFVVAGSSWREQYDRPIADPKKLTRDPRLAIEVARRAKMPVVVLEHVPFQPIFDGKKEDDAIAHTFRQFVLTGDESWPMLLPMVRSVVRGMDAAQAAAQKEWGVKLDKFLVTGASKRGWTTWLTGAVDPRVAAIAPQVIDVLRMGPQMEHQLATWGAYSEEIGDYTARGLQALIPTAIGQRLNQLVDPYSYREQLRQPKLIILGTNDRYWPLDACNLYWNDLEGEKHLLYVPNQGHGIRDIERVLGTVSAQAQQMAGRLTLPKQTWRLDESDKGLKLTFKTNVTPLKVSAWQTTMPTRDFREARWSAKTLNASDGVFAFESARPVKEFSALFGEAEYRIGDQHFFLSTNVRIQTPASPEPRRTPANR